MEIDNVVVGSNPLGSSNSHVWQRIFEAIDVFIGKLKDIYPPSSTEHALPRGYTFRYSQSGEYQLIRPTGEYGLYVRLSSNFEVRKDHVLRFCRDVTSGFVGEIIADTLEDESAKLKFAADILEECDLRSSNVLSS
jgi:hypothetical protein